MKRCLVLIAFISALLRGATESSIRVLDANRYLLGGVGMAEWDEFARTPRHGAQLDLTFTAEANGNEATLLIRQRNVKATWNVLLNGQKIGVLEPLNQPLVRAFAIPAGAMQSGENRLSIVRTPSLMIDDVVVGEIKLDPRPRSSVLGEAILEVAVTDKELARGIPCRITLTDREGALAPVHVSNSKGLAVRTGVIYTAAGTARIGVAPGDYVLYASRGFEYGVATQPVTVAAGETKTIALQIRREVPTPNLVACDTHIHTLTYSKHGDATVDERMITIAGEGIELAVATDHNHHVDYTEAAARTGMTPHFRSVVGNEVSTKVGHFNAFPVAADGTVPNAQLTDWSELLHNIRTVTGAKVVTLNHPRDVHANFIPFGPDNFDATTGKFRHTPKLAVDAIEVVTSAAMQSDIMRLYHDWFALLNHGVRVASVGASDTHHVSEFILGQARTYAIAQDVDPASIDVDAVCSSYQTGRLFVSLGLLAKMTVDDRFGVGDLATDVGRELKVVVEILGPSWTQADRVELFANGIKIREQGIVPSERVQKARVTWQVPRPKQDVHLVAIATGPGVTAPFWEIPRPYRPTSKRFTPRVLGSTNPIWIDADGDRKFSSARDYAAKAVERAGGSAEKLAAALAGFDQAVAIQVADLLAALRR